MFRPLFCVAGTSSPSGSSNLRPAVPGRPQKPPLPGWLPNPIGTRLSVQVVDRVTENRSLRKGEGEFSARSRQRSERTRLLS